jgi:hypothetical protein
MSSQRILTDSIKFSDEVRAIELLDWETKPDDFDKLFAHVIQTICQRKGISRERIFSTLAEPDLRKEVRRLAEMFQEKHLSLVMYIYMRLNFGSLPQSAKAH